jgi:hypothetical protein
VRLSHAAGDAAGDATLSFVEFIRTKQGQKGKSGSDATKLKNFVAYHRKCRRMENGRYVNGAYVEYEMVCAVANQNRLLITVAQANTPELQVVTPDGSFIAYGDERAEASPFFLWCTGGHYQAMVKLQDVQVLPSALNSPRFKLGNCLTFDEILIPE